MIKTQILKGLKRDFEVTCLLSLEASIDYATNLIKDTLCVALAKDGAALMAGAGGSTPKAVYQALSECDLDWKNIVLTQVDERFVPTDDKSSNTLMMNQALAHAVSQGLKFISLIEDDQDQGICVAKARASLAALGQGLEKGTPPVFDLVLLGMGNDAHFASIFPHHEINEIAYDTDESVLAVAASGSDQEPLLPRISLSVSALNRAEKIILYITGQQKLDVLTNAVKSDDRQTSPIGAFLNQCPVRVDIIWAA